MESWKATPMPHRKFCPILKKIFQVHESAEHTARSSEPSKWHAMYMEAGVSDVDMGEAMKYVVMLLEHFSEYKD